MAADTTMICESPICVEGINSPLLEFGPGQSDEAWVLLVGPVGGYARVIVIDMPGFGVTNKPVNFDYRVGGGLQSAPEHMDMFVNVQRPGYGLCPELRVSG